jgi:hypothetical protein
VSAEGVESNTCGRITDSGHWRGAGRPSPEPLPSSCGSVCRAGEAGALFCTIYTVAGFTNKSLRGLVAGLLGADYSANQMTYDLSKPTLSWPSWFSAPSGLGLPT